MVLELKMVVSTMLRSDILLVIQDINVVCRSFGTWDVGIVVVFEDSDVEVQMRSVAETKVPFMYKKSTKVVGVF